MLVKFIVSMNERSIQMHPPWEESVDRSHSDKLRHTYKFVGMGRRQSQGGIQIVFARYIEDWKYFCNQHHIRGEE